MNAAITFAFGAGLLATVNPCGFALLPSFLGLYLGTDEAGAETDTWLSRAARGFLVGLVLSAAFSAVFIFAGLVVSAGLRTFLDAVPWLAVAIGAGLTVLGLMMLAGRHVGLWSASRIGVHREAGGYRQVATFGATYAVASLSCTLGVFLVVVAQALAVGSIPQLLAVFAAYAAGSASLLIALSVSAALAKGALARVVHRAAPALNRGAGALLAASGVYLILYWLPALGSGRSGFSDSWAAHTTRQLSADLSAFFSAHTAAFAVGLGGLTIAGVAILSLEWWRRSRVTRINQTRGHNREPEVGQPTHLDLDLFARTLQATFPGREDASPALALLCLLAKGQPVRAATLARNLDRAENDVAARLTGWPNVESDERGAVVGFSGLTLAPTRHSFVVGGRQLYTWCAWDSLFLPALLKSTAQVRSSCPVTGKEVELMVGPDGVERSRPPGLFVSFPPPPLTNTAGITGSFCCEVFFLAGAEAAGAWRSSHPDAITLDLDAALELGRRAVEPLLDATSDANAALAW